MSREYIDHIEQLLDFAEKNDVFNKPSSWEFRYFSEEVLDALQMASEALEKQLPKKPLEQRYVNYEIENELIGHCPSCRIKWDVAFWQRYCSNCGQKLDWSEE